MQCSRHVLWTISLAFAVFVRPAAADPVFEFIVEADSLAKTDEAAFASFVADQGVLVGAAVGQLLDIAFEIEAQDVAAATENVDFAARLAALHEQAGGSSGPGELVATHRAWTEAQKERKRQAQALEAEAASARQAGESERDIELLGRAAAIYAEIVDERALAVNAGTRGVAHWYRGDWDAVEEAYQEALRRRRAIDDAILEGRTLNGLGSVRFQQNQFEEALVWYERAVDLRERTGDTVGLATSLTYASNCQQALGRLVEARRLLERALPVLEASGDDRKRIEALHAVGVLYRNMRRTAEAVRALEDALALVSVAPEFEAGIRLDLAGALREQGRSREALEQIARAGELVGEAVDPALTYQLLTGRGLASMALGEVPRALDELGAARDVAQQMGVPELLSQAETNVAIAEALQGDYETSLATATRALERAREADSVRFEIEAMQVVADALVALGRHQEALERLDPLLARLGDVDESLGIDLRAVRGNALTLLGRYGAARDELRAVRRWLMANGLVEMEWVPLMGIGDSFETLAPDSARTYYEAAFAALERHRAAAGSGAVRTGYLDRQRGELYEAVVHFYADQAWARGGDRQGWSSSAFRTAERARARGLLDLVRQSIAVEDDPAVAGLLDALYALDENDPSTHEERTRLKDEIARRFDARVAAEVSWLQGEDPIVGLDGLSASLPEGMVALVYSVGAEASYVWAVDARGHDLLRLPARADLSDRVVALREAIEAPGFGDRALGEQAHALHRELIAPAASRLRGADRVWIVPDGILFEIPFELLLEEDPGDRPDWRRAKYLARERTLGYAPSASLLVQLAQAGAAGATPRVVALGDPDFTTLSRRVGTTVDLPPLPQSRREVETLVRLRGDQAVTLIESQATESALRDALESARPSIVHLATHGLVDREEPSLTCVALADDPTDADDGYLHTLEILSLPFDTELVVLSACDTGRGKLERGEGTVGLTRSFLAAGARRVVASLWPVADASTGTLMSTFYEELGERRTVDDALNRARARLWSERETAHPYYWAPFVLMGSDAPLPDAARG